MSLKTNLHFHTSEDRQHALAYTLREGIDRAAKLGFEVLAVTCHGSVVATDTDVSYAAEKGVLLISGIEAYIRCNSSDVERHVIVLNCRKDIEEVKTFSELEKYRREHPEIFILAPHPYFYGNFSLHEHLEPHIRLFDAIEHSWFYSKFFNRNKKAREVAKKHNMPFIATSDTHFFDFFDENYAVIEAEEKTPEAVFRAIKENRFQNITHPRSALMMAWKFGIFSLVDAIRKKLRILLKYTK
ncbi:MAG: hypothetical protein BMS9Abin13_050 [Patescibacteria group bacterium]|nr:MAG: hypothetical protein BMS9Abin13_050 [Patescibacteria group bacterium]